MARVRIDRGEIMRAIRGASMRELRVVGPLVTARAKVLAPVDTGRLRASIGPPEYRRTFTLRPEVSVVAHTDYAKYVHDGTRPHTIRPRQAQALRFLVGGRVVYAKVVNHPGTRARPFLDQAAREIAGSRGYRIRDT